MVKKEQLNAAPTFGVSKRLTPALAARGFAAVPTIFLNAYSGHLKITPTQAMVIIHLLNFKWDEKRPFPRLSLIANKMGLTESSVRSHLRNLEKAGLLERISRPGHSNEFDLQPLFKKLEELLASEPPKPVRKSEGGTNEEIAA